VQHKLYIIIGAYGSGKSEYALHLARKLKSQGLDIVLADMDVVNPYFRSRSVREDFAELGIEIIAPEGGFKHADLPMISPRIRGAIHDTAKTVILDVGGDPAGCRALGRFVADIEKRGYEMLFVVNTLRPFTGSVEDIAVMHEVLEFSSKLKVTELICNTNLMQETTSAMITEGVEIVLRAAELLQVQFRTFTVLEEYISDIALQIQGINREVMTYTLKKPWEYQGMETYKI